MNSIRNCLFNRIKIAANQRYLCSTKKKHPYDNILFLNSSEELAKFLCENIIYDDNGIVAVNKPYGVSFSRDIPNWRKNTIKKNDNIIRHKIKEAVMSSPRISSEDDKVNLHDALPYIKSYLNCDSLCIIKSPEKYTSGVCLFGRSDMVKNKVNLCWERAKAQKSPLESYLAICSGVPIKTFLKNFKIAIGLEVTKNGKSKKAVLTSSYSHNDVLKSRVHIATVDSVLLSTCESLASLVLLNSNKKKWHFIRLFLATHLLSPAIGDHLYGSMVKQVMGTHLLVDKWSEFASSPQKLNSDLLKKLDLLPGSERFIPTMIHLSEIKLSKFFNKSKDLLIAAPPPSYFNWTMEKLGLYLPPDYAILGQEKTDNKIKSYVQ